MDIKNIHQHGLWYASHEESKQGAALIECQQLKIRQLSDVIKTISAEIELCENPKEFSYETIIESIKVLINNTPEISCTKGYFKWIG